jgi:uncharacterized protein (DUF433 family)/DNA-binding transcriptional MerR regulator
MADSTRYASPMSEHATTLSRGIYAPGDAARLAHLDIQRLRRLLAGYTFRAKGGARRRAPPVFPRDDASGAALTFDDLIEVLYVKGFRDHGVSMQHIRKVHDEARREFANNHPFATKQFETDGRRIFRRFVQLGKERVEDARLKQQVERVVFDPLMKTIDHDSITKDATTYWPLGRGTLVMLDPRYAFGEPVVSKSHVPTRVLHEAARNSSRQTVARWYKVSLEEVDAAVAYEESLDSASRAA